MVNLKVLYFASVREITEKSEESLCLKVKEGNDELTTSELVQILVSARSTIFFIFIFIMTTK